MYPVSTNSLRRNQGTYSDKKSHYQKLRIVTAIVLHLYLVELSLKTFVVTRLYLDTTMGNRLVTFVVMKFIRLFSAQDQRRLGAIVVPNNDEVLAEAKRKSLIDENGEVAKDEVMNMLYDELRTW